MIRIYRMWRFVRLVEHKFMAIKDMSDKKSEFKKHARTMTDVHCVFEFSDLKSIIGRKYGFNNAMRALLMAGKLGYIEEGASHPDSSKDLIITGSGINFTSITVLVNELSKSIASVGSLIAVVIATIALYVSLKS